jgi:soluble lytic murein transglycosylase-like protein
MKTASFRWRVLLAVWLASMASIAHAGAPPFTTTAERCILPAARYHQVNAQVLRAILVVESGLNPTALGRNRNGTMDVGMGQMNSIHFSELAKHGIAPANLLDPCVATYVAAWHLRRVMNEDGNTWSGIAKYHSSNSYFNYRYQVLLNNELVRSRVIQGRMLAVPPLVPGATARPAKFAGGHAPAVASTQAASVVFDSQSGTSH